MTHVSIARRRFLKQAAASFAFTYVPRRAWGANDRPNLASIGVGGKGAGEVRNLAAEGCNVVALCDVDLNRAAQTISEYSDAVVYSDFRVMLDRQQNIDLVSVSTPDHTHAVAAAMALRMGKHVYCQKPLTHSIYEARVLTELAKQMGVATQMGNQAHAGEAIRRGVELIRAGIIGPVHEVHAWTNRPIWPQGQVRPADVPPVPDHLDWDLWLGPAPSRPYHPDYVPFKWRGRWDFGTGALGDMGCHIMDMPYWALGLSAPESVEAVSEGGTGESPPVWSTVTYQFPARQNSPPVKLVWYDGSKGDGPDAAKIRNLPPREVSEGHDLQPYDLVMVGEKGKMFFQRSLRRDGKPNWMVTPQALAEDFAPPPESIPRVANEDAEWIAACQGGPPALANFQYSGPFTETVLLGNLAVRLGRRIEWDSVNLVAKGEPEADQFIRREYRAGWSL